jgi:membrane dipeptidase
MNWCVIVLALLLSAQKSWSYPSARFEEANSFEKYLEKARTVLDRVPLIDGYKKRHSFQIVRKLLTVFSNGIHRHNDFPYSLRRYENNQVGDLDINDLTTSEPWASSSSSHTDINRLRQGKVGAQV